MPHLLLVDDDPEAIEWLSELAKAEGFSVATADSLRAARIHMSRLQPDIMLTDLQLPDGKGIDLVADLETRASTEVVIGRGKAMVRSATLPLGSGVLAATHLSDPPKPEERARLRRAALHELTHAPDGDVERLVATGGTASNLPLVLTHRNPPPVLTTADLLTCESRLDVGRASAVAKSVELPPTRVKAMRGGVEALLLLLDWYGLAVLHISHQGLRHGMLLAYLERGNDWWR